MAGKIVIGLTGNIASGKSLVGRMLVEKGADLVDADRVAHEALAAGADEVGQIAERFGADVVGPDGAVDRAALGRLVFGDPEALADLEAIVHPGTRRRIYERLEASPSRVVVLEAIKLIEGPLVDHVDTVWVVTAPAPVRIRRLIEERGLSAADAERRVAAQNPEEEKVHRADIVIPNAGTLDELTRLVNEAWDRLTEGAGHQAEAARE